MHFKRELVGRFDMNSTIQAVNKAIADKMEETGYTNVLTRYLDKNGRETLKFHEAQSIYISVEE